MEVHQFDSRVEEMRRQLQQALLSYGISTPVGVTSAGATGREAGRQRPVVEDNGSEDMSKFCTDVFSATEPVAVNNYVYMYICMHAVVDVKITH